MEPLRHVLIAVSLLVSVVMIGAVGFMYIEGLEPLNALYLAIATVTTVGYGDIVPLTPEGKIFTAGLIIAGVGVALYVLVEIIESVLEGRLSKAFGIARVKRSVAKMNKHKIICGGGRTGNIVADEFGKEGLDFVVVEHDAEVAKELRKKDIALVEGDATKDETLKEAGVERASGLVSTLPSDCSNLLLCITARDLNTNLELVARASSQEAAKRLYSIGAKKVVIVEEIGGRRLARSLTKPAIVDFLDFATTAGETSLESLKVGPGTKIANKKIKELRIEEKIGATIVAIIRDDKVISDFGPEDELRVGDTVVVIGKKKSLEKFEELDSL
ncbi:voltage-gated potassium channel [Candidatus Methanophagaceae archaeon]|nr:voltage-gated potassium channel [Methanophagales archaeon]